MSAAHPPENDACEGVCLSGYDIGLPSGDIAYPHPDCPQHGEDWRPSDNKWSRDYVARHPERFPTRDDRPRLRVTDGCACAYAWRSLGRVYDQDMGEAWVRATTERECPLHGDGNPRRADPTVIPPASTSGEVSA